jgi:hypothetical protein
MGNEPNNTDAEAERLLEVLNAYHVPPEDLEAGLPDFSVESKNKVAALVAGASVPPPPARLLARLLFIRTGENEADVAAALTANLESPEPEARAASLYGLQQLRHPGLVEFARGALADNAGGVLLAACSILVPEAKGDPALLQTLQEVYASRAGQKEFHASANLLKAQLDITSDA